MIGDDIRIVVVAIGEDTVRIGIDAPKETAINRREIWKRIQKEKG
jgi:carbon storage regulator